MIADQRLLAVYEAVRTKRDWMFAPYFFTGFEGKRRARVILRHVIEEKLKWTHEEVCQFLSRATFAEFRLAGMLKTYFDHAVFDALDNAYPGTYRPWELLRARRGVFAGERRKENARAAIRWMVKEQLHCSGQDLHLVSHRTFRAYHLDEMLAMVYNGSPWAALQDAGLCDGLWPWQVNRTPNGYWHAKEGKNRAIEAVHWLIEDQLHLNIQEVAPHVSFQCFKEHGLGPMLQEVFGGSPFNALDATYPGRWKPWELGHVGNGFWSGDQGDQHMEAALRWLCDDILCMPPCQAANIVTRKTLQRHGLGGLFTQYFNESMPKIQEALRSLGKQC